MATKDTTIKRFLRLISTGRGYLKQRSKEPNLQKPSQKRKWQNGTARFWKMFDYDTARSSDMLGEVVLHFTYRCAHDVTLTACFHSAS